MNNITKISAFLIITFISQTILAHNDSTLYLKTQYHHILKDNINTNKRIVVYKEMRNSDNQIFREVFYNKETGAEDYIKYHYYNSDNTISLITTNNPKEQIEKYDKYFYKKKKLRKIEEYEYNAENNVSQLVLTKKIKNKKGVKTTIHLNNKNETIKTIKEDYKDDQLLKRETVAFYTDSAVKTTLTINIDSVGTIQSKHYQRINNKDTVNLTHRYFYLAEGKIDKIETYNNKNNKLLYTTEYKYNWKGILWYKNIKLPGNQNLYKEINYYTYTKHTYNRLPINPPPTSISKIILK